MYVKRFFSQLLFHIVNYLNEIFLKAISAHSLWLFAYSVICIFCAFVWPFFFCMFATSASEQVSYTGRTMYNSNWYYFPLKQQKYVVLVVNRSQDILYFTGMNLIRCTLESFAKVRSIQLIQLNKFVSLNERFFIIIRTTLTSNKSLTHFEYDMIFFLILQLIHSSFSYYVIFRKV